MRADDYFSGKLDKQAKAILGPKAKLPKVDPVLDKAVDVASDFDRSTYLMGKKTVDAAQDIVNLIVKLKSELRKYLAVVQKDDFGLDEKDKEAAKRVKVVKDFYASNIGKVNDLLDGTLDNCESYLDNNKDLAKPTVR